MKNILIMMLMFIVSIFSQEILRVKATKTLVAPTETGVVYMNPHWSPDGKKIAFTSANFRGIWMYEFETKQILQISSEMSAGFGFSWSSNSQALLARVSRFVDNRRMSAIKIYHLGQHEDDYLTDYRMRIPDIPRLTPKNDQIFFYNGRELEYLSTPFEKSTNESNFICYAISDLIYLENSETGEKKEFQPISEAIYLNLNLSPDNRHVAFEVYGGSCYVLDLKNGAVCNLGQGNYPMWSPDGKFIVFMIIQDDGHRYTASDIVISNIEGTLSQNLTSEIDNIAMYPSWSPFENKIAYSTYDLGTIEVIEFDQ